MWIHQRNKVTATGSDIGQNGFNGKAVLNFRIQRNINRYRAIGLVERRTINGQDRRVSRVFKDRYIATNKRDLSVGIPKEASVSVGEVNCNGFIRFDDFITRRRDLKRSSFTITFTRIECNALGVESEITC